MGILELINDIKKNCGYQNPVYTFTHGKCYEFAKKLQYIVGGEIIYLTKHEHAVLLYHGKLYDVTGNVTKKYINEKFISEEEMIKRYKCFR